MSLYSCNIKPNSSVQKQIEVVGAVAQFHLTFVSSKSVTDWLRQRTSKSFYNLKKYKKTTRRKSV